MRDKVTENWKQVADAVVRVDQQCTGFMPPKKLRKILEKLVVPVSDEHFEKYVYTFNLSNTNFSIEYLIQILQMNVNKIISTENYRCPAELFVTILSHVELELLMQFPAAHDQNHFFLIFISVHCNFGQLQFQPLILAN